MAFQVRSWPNVILHLDGDAFFVSVLQAVNPKLKGKPVISGSDRGIATAVSYEAKKYGITRAMPISQVKKLCSECIILSSDYELYSLFSKKMFKILRRFSPTVEEYSIDEAFADLKGLRRPLNMTYSQIGQAIKDDIEKSLGITVSIGISLSKSLAKLASNFKKPSGLTLVSGLNIEPFLSKIQVSSIWGVGENTASYMKKLGIYTCMDLAQKPEEFVRQKFSKPIYEIWKELRGERIYEIDPSRKTTYKSMQDTRTFPPTNTPHVLWAKLLDHVEQAFARARYLNYTVGKVSIFLKTQQFKYHSTEIKFVTPVSYPLLVRKDLKEAFKKIYKKGVLYRSAGCSIYELKDQENTTQQTLFLDNEVEDKVKKLYPILESKKISFGVSLFDKERVVRKKAKPRFSLPVIEIT